MEVFSFDIDPKDERQVQGPRIMASNPCPCGCSPKTFVLVSDGKVGVTARFETEEELKAFQQDVACLRMPHAEDCRYCVHLVDVRPPRTRHWIGGCEFDLRPDKCGEKFQLHEYYAGKDPRIEH